ncbi:short-chain fatty acid transporter [Stutzerimonas nosocomialis]|uniref:Short-chain fatty acid transporter n=1 Tax=Stutzerimonas nosocomialis TaxID=1056496 RepID=A0A5R9QAA0_9GAMM|nr:short-chain fatty acid transporter [Stutzerimonas nosocomialis]TLX61615.1 short-chain fatty acid transporter [Stutzerimonas nosocomialis]
MLNRITGASVYLVQRFLPSPFVFALLLSFIVLVASMLSTGQGLPAMATHWGNGFWNLLSFTMQMALILVTGHALARAPMVNRLLDRLARVPRTPGQAIITVTLVGLAGAWINWGFGLVIGAVFARALARQVRGVDYPLLVAAAYSGFLIWHGGFSGSIPLSLASGGADLERMSGGVLTAPISVGQTLFAPFNLIIIAVLVVGLPLLNWAMQPKQPTVADPAQLAEPEPAALPRETATQRLDDSRILGLLTVALAVIFFVGYFASSGFVLSLNIVIMLFLFAGLALHGTPERYTRAVQESIGGISGIVIQFPFYAGIMGMMVGANAEGISLGRQVTDTFVAWSSTDSFPVLAFLSAGLVNVFVPSGGGQWAVQGPIMLPAGAALGVAPEVTAMAIAWGDAWTNMIQPFWALPLLGIAGLGARDIMGYCLITLVFSGLVIAGGFYFLV